MISVVISVVDNRPKKTLRTVKHKTIKAIKYD